MHVTVGKILSLVIALGYVIATIVSMLAEGQDPPVAILFSVLVLCAALLFPLAMIWFPEELGSFTGYVGRGGWINTETPEVLVSILGWFFLVGMPVIVVAICMLSS